MSTRRAAFECNTSTASSNRSGQVKISKLIRRKSIEYRLTNVISVVCVMFGTGLAASAKNMAGEIDKVYGRPNIEPAHPTNPGNGAALYRRSSDSQLKGTNIVDAAHYYSSHLPSAPSIAVGYAPPVPSSGNYMWQAPSRWNGNYAPPPSPTENYVPPSLVGNYASHIPPNAAGNYVPPIFTENHVPPSPTENYPSPIFNGHYASPIAHTGPFRYLDNKECVKSVQHVHWPSLKYALRYYDKHYTVQSPAYTPDEKPPIHVNKKHVEGDKDDEKARKKDDKKRDAKTQKYDEDYAPKPAEGYGFKKLIVPVYDVYNQKAHKPPTYDLSDLIFPADSYNSPPSLPYSADGYEDKTPVDQSYDSKSEDEYEPTGEIDSFGVMPYKEKKKKTLPYHLNPSSLIIRQEDYAPTGRDEFGVLPYKESIGGSSKKTYQSTSAPSTGNGPVSQPLPPKETFGEGHAIDSGVAERTKNSHEVNPTANVKNSTAGEPEAMFRSELDPVDEIDDNESAPEENVISEAFLKGSELRSDLTVKTKKEKSQSEVQSNMTGSEESTTFGTPTNALEPSTTGSITMPPTDVTELARNSTSSIESDSSQEAIVAETTTTIVVITTLQNVSEASASISAGILPTAFFNVTTELTIARESFHRQMTAEDEESITDSREVREFANDFDDFASPSIGPITTTSASTTTDAESTSQTTDELTTLTSTPITASSTISPASNSSKAVVTQFVNNQPGLDSVITTESFVNSDELKSRDKLSTVSVTNSTVNESNSAPSKGTGLDGRDKRNVSVGQLRSALGRTPDVKNKPKDWIGMRPALFQRDVLDNGDVIMKSPPPPSPAAPPPTLASTSAGLTPPVTPLTADFASALAQAEKERQKLSEPGPSILCPGMRTQVGSACSPFFTCNTDGKLLSCWDGEDDTAELVFDPTSQECRKFEAIPACTKETICAGKSGLTLIGGECTRLAFSCPKGDLTKCDVPGTAVSPTGECVFNQSVDSCTSLVDKI